MRETKFQLSTQFCIAPLFLSGYEITATNQLGNGDSEFVICRAGTPAEGVCGVIEGSSFKLLAV